MDILLLLCVPFQELSNELDIRVFVVVVVVVIGGRRRFITCIIIIIILVPIIIITTGTQNMGFFDPRWFWGPSHKNMKKWRTRIYSPRQEKKWQAPVRQVNGAIVDNPGGACHFFS
jgi:hypothetical protein